MSSQSLSTPIRSMVFSALFAALLCVVAPFSLYIGPIPLSFATLVIYIAAGSLGYKQGLASVVLYVLLGAIGLPVFTGFEGGFHKIAGVTGGFIIGYIPLAYFTGLFAQIARDSRKMSILISILGMVIGTTVLYICGVAWFMLQTGAGLLTALMACVTPFIIGDSIKIAAATIITPQLRSLIMR